MSTYYHCPACNHPQPFREILKAVAALPLDAPATPPAAPAGEVDSPWDDDRRDDFSDTIDRLHPMKTGNHKHYERALQLVGNRYSKGALVELVNALLALAAPKPAGD